MPSRTAPPNHADAASLATTAQGNPADGNRALLFGRLRKLGTSGVERRDPGEPKSKRGVGARQNLGKQAVALGEVFVAGDSMAKYNETTLPEQTCNEETTPPPRTPE